MWRVVFCILSLSVFAVDHKSRVKEIKDINEKTKMVERVNLLYNELESSEILSDEQIVLKRALSHLNRFEEFNEDECNSVRSTLKSSYGRATLSQLPDMVIETLAVLDKICAN